MILETWCYLAKLFSHKNLFAVKVIRLWMLCKDRFTFQHWTISETRRSTSAKIATSGSTPSGIFGFSYYFFTFFFPSGFGLLLGSFFAFSFFSGLGSDVIAVSYAVYTFGAGFYSVATCYGTSDFSDFLMISSGNSGYPPVLASSLAINLSKRPRVFVYWAIVN